MWLDKPDPNKPVFKILPVIGELVHNRKCPMCKKIVNTGDVFNKKYSPERLSSPFRDELSRKEYTISGMCQDCQDMMFGE